MKKLLLTIISIVSLYQPSFAQKYPKDFILPLKIPVAFSGNYAELRRNHYHAGLDYRTQQREGLNIYAVQEGYVSRINISPYGYGKAVYITHPNGYTTVYGHLSELSGVINERARQEQYNKESYSVDFKPEPNELKVKQGDVIALSGNTGGSGGPHLHFEVRDTKTEEVLNPFLFGFDVNDVIKPQLEGVWIYPVDGLVNNSNSKVVAAAGGTYSVAGEIGFGVRAFDRQNTSSFKNGIYFINTYVNNKLISTFKANGYYFNESRFINAGTDYTHRLTQNSWIYRTYLLPGNSLRMYEDVVNKGILNVKEGETYNIKIEVGDYAGNTTNRFFTLKGNSYSPQPLAQNKEYIRYDKEYTLSENGVKVIFEQETFYESFNFNYSKNGEKHQLHNSSVPLHKRFSLTIEPDWNVLDKSQADHYIIVRQSNYGSAKTDFLDTEYKNGVYTANPNEFGVFYLTLDNVPPTIFASSLSKTKSVSKRMSFIIKDGVAGIKDYKICIDGKWILAEYEYKNNTLFIRDLSKEGVERGSHEIEVTVTDKANNKTIYTNSFEKI